MHADVSEDDDDCDVVDEAHTYGFIASHKLKDVDDGLFCPIVRIPRRRETPPNGDPLIYGLYGDRVFFENDMLDDPGFLVLHLAGIQPDSIVELAATSLHTSLRSLLETCGNDVPVHYERIRTALEVRKYMEAHRWLYSHVIVIGHGGPDGIRFIDCDKPLAKTKFAEILGCAQDCREMQVISLCCHSGCEDMASELSRDPSVSEVIAPDGGFDVRWPPCSSPPTCSRCSTRATHPSKLSKNSVTGNRSASGATANA